MRHRVLVVEDHPWWTLYISSALAEMPQYELVGAVPDGIEAVLKARELKPDLILLDVGLPGLDGIRAGERILADSPRSRILFVSEQRSLDIVEAALATGAQGYMIKSDVGTQLRPAMAAVLEGQRYISAKLGGRDFEAMNDGRLTREIRHHEAWFYANESSLLGAYIRFAETALTAGNSLVLIVSTSQRDRLYQRLRARGVDIDRAINEQRCLWVDVPAALSSFMVDGSIDETRFWNAATALILDAARGAAVDPPRVSVCGDGAATLLQESRADAAIRVEQLWSDVARTFNVEIFCPYSSHGFRCDDENEVFRDIRAAHSAVYVR